ncbi:uncharacterized protein DFL_005631 [Arthrobotrys flagrans]|uniref:Uncharacterized protein n=1 Tax=Arthrobotrys flagrans TaxID=97331 RepID=A0A436ZXZ1_ARTFL|nr:hypothetical protein DFL_005631 [Arthrobotrys flagrans]
MKNQFDVEKNFEGNGIGEHNGEEHHGGKNNSEENNSREDNSGDNSSEDSGSKYIGDEEVWGRLHEKRDFSQGEPTPAADVAIPSQKRR